MFPGLAVAEVLREQGHEVSLFVSEKEIDARALGERPGLTIEKLPSVGLPSLFSPAIIAFIRRMIRSLRQCHGAFRRQCPDAVLGMGGFTSMAPLMVARWQGVPTFLHESNAIPGKANRLAARLCRKVLLGFSECAPHFSRLTCVTGTPIRRELTFPALSREEARRLLGLDPARATVLVMGGSQGATGINALMTQAAPHLKNAAFQIIHLAGDRCVETVSAAYAEASLPAKVLSFCDRMQEVYPAADLVVSRSGAASLGELSWFGLPSVLIPYPYAAEDHQRLNAEIFSKAGAAHLILEKETTGEKLAALLPSLLASPETLAIMATSARRLAPQDAAEKVAKILEEVVA